MTKTESPESTRETLNQAAVGQLASMHVGCPGCGKTYLLPLQNVGPSGPMNVTLPDHLECESCFLKVPFHSSSVDTHRPLESCALCGTEEFFVQKDFNRKLGFFLVVISGLIAFLIMLYEHILGLPVLFAVTIVDWIIYQRMRTVSVCYLCHTIYRVLPPNSDHKGFYLGSEERFKKPRQEWIKGLKE